MIAKILDSNGTGKLTIQCETQKKFKTGWLEIKQVKEPSEEWKTIYKLRALFNILIDTFTETNNGQWSRNQVEFEFKIIGECYEMVYFNSIKHGHSILNEKSRNVLPISWDNGNFESGVMTLEKASKCYELVMEFLRNSYPKLYTEFMLRYIQVKQNRG